MTTYLARSKDGRTKHISAYTYSDAFQQASDWAGGSMLESCDEI